jgi:succinate dehydrogenase/fumarate reductase flavoprotein subunit
MNSLMGGHYPSGGITLGPAMVFGWLAGRHAATSAAACATPSRGHQPQPGEAVSALSPE